MPEKWRATQNKTANTYTIDVIFPVDNRGGAGGIIGMQAVANADPDGYTILVSPSGPLAINPWIYSKLDYDPVKSFTPISLLGKIPLVLVVNPSVPAKSVEELVKLAKASPGKINFASSGSGTAQHLAAELFKAKTQIDIVHVPYKIRAALRRKPTSWEVMSR